MALKQLLGLAALCAVATAGTARADVIYSQTPIHGSLKFKLGTYDPRRSIDDAVPDGDPYQELFGTTGMLLFELGYDHYIWQDFGTVGAGLSLGYAEKYAAALVADNPSVRSQEKVGLRIIPLRLMALYNFDYAARTWNVPLVPYARLGVSWTHFTALKGGEVEQVNGEDFTGGNWGYAATVGLSLLLDVLEPRMAADFDTGMGVNNSYFFAEYNVARADDFGGAGLDLSSNYWMFGLALEL